jgi:hypothetical protein
MYQQWPTYLPDEPVRTGAAQLRVAADERPFAGPALKRLVHLTLHGVTAAADRVVRELAAAAVPLCRWLAKPLAAERVIR